MLENSFLTENYMSTNWEQMFHTLLQLGYSLLLCWVQKLCDVVWCVEQLLTSQLFMQELGLKSLQDLDSLILSYFLYHLHCEAHVNYWHNWLLVISLLIVIDSKAGEIIHLVVSVRLSRNSVVSNTAKKTCVCVCVCFPMTIITTFWGPLNFVQY